MDFEVVVVSKIHGDSQLYIEAAGMAAWEILKDYNIPVYVVPRTDWNIGLGLDFSEQIEIYMGGEKVEPPAVQQEMQLTSLVEWFKQKILEKLFELDKIEATETGVLDKKLEMGEAEFLLQPI